MRNVSLFLLILILMISCKKDVVFDIKSQEDLDKNITNSYIKIAYDSENIEMKKCDDFNFEFKDVEIIKLSKSDFGVISEGLLNAKLNSVQNIPGSDFYIEYRGYKFCLNHLGNIIRNNRKMNDNPELAHLIKVKSKYYDQFSEAELEKKDSLVAWYGLPFNHESNDSLVVKSNLATKKNIIITY